MEKEKWEGLLIDYIDGNLNEVDRATVEKGLDENQEVVTLYRQLKEVMGLLDNVHHVEPSFSLRAKFVRSLSEEISAVQKTSSKTPAGNQAFFKPWVLRAAAGVILVIVGIVIGDRISVQRQHDEAIAKVQEQLDEQKRMMMGMLKNQQSASQRVMGATVAYEMEQAPDDEIVNALVKAMDEDPSTNVRLTALEALGKFYQQGHVRAKLIKSLSTQKDPVVQIALIRLLVQMKEKEVVNQLEKITHDDMIIKAVKDEAHTGILKLL
ncbi:MAG TPA: HEAT repeat domain-containing protein [Cyclobacteriaceae bacterium]|jgi:anti-sigma factor RsiW|nr:HEAT repeat domain-containing protein [Cyclobacteriaceae bacterium]